jgi:hypothetical protein
MKRDRFKDALPRLLLPVLLLFAIPMLSTAHGSVGASARHPRAEPRIKHTRVHRLAG